VSLREPMFLIAHAAGRLCDAVAVEDRRWVGRDTTGRRLFNRRDLAGANRAARPHRTLVSSAWWGIRATRPRQSRSQRILHDRRACPTSPTRGRCTSRPAVRPPSPSPSTTGRCAAGPATPPSTTASRGTPTSRPATRTEPPLWTDVVSRSSTVGAIRVTIRCPAARPHLLGATLVTAEPGVAATT
jgi:hypothetical protein